MHRQAWQTWDDAERHRHQSGRFEAMVAEIRNSNAFYGDKWRDLPEKAFSLDRLSSLPFTTKKELLEDQQAHPPFGRNLTYPLAAYPRVHQTSGSRGTPLRVVDTEASWSWWAECWQYILDVAGVTEADVVMLAFSFGPFIGFWAAQEAVVRRGAMMVPGGGMTSPQRLAMMRDLGATVLLCTPSYALHLAQVAREQGLDPARDLKVRVTIHAGEPGASTPATRERIESLWGARTFDHPGASEIGAFGFSCSARRGVHVNEAEFVVEVIDPATGIAVPPDQQGELVLTNLGRVGFPVVRYRSNDIVKPLARHVCSCGRTSLLLEGGILGRNDDMVTIRGVNVFPAAFQELFDRLPWVMEHRITAFRHNHLEELHVEFESADPADHQETVHKVLREMLGIRVSLQQCPPNSLPRYELKAKRFIDRRGEDWQPSSGETPAA